MNVSRPHLSALQHLFVRHWQCYAWLLAALLLLVIPALCQAQVKRELIRLELTISAADDVNPNEQEQAAPIKVRIYELQSAAAFRQADFLTLHDQEQTVLGADLLVRDEFILRPGEQRSIRRWSHHGSTALGVLAAYRDLPNAGWRAVYPLEAPEAAWYRSMLPAPKARLRIDLRRHDINLTEIR